MGMFKESQGGTPATGHLDEAVPSEARRRARDAKSWDLTPRQLCDLELLLNGAFAPLEGFMSAAEYGGVLRDMRLPSGAVWPVPVTLDVSEVFAAGLQRGDTIALRDAEGLLAAIMEVGEIWRPEKDEEARAVYGTHDEAHPGVSCLLHRTHPVYVSGRVTGFEPILHYDHRALRDSPAELHERFHKLGWRRVVAFQTRNPLPAPRSSSPCRPRVRAKRTFSSIPSWERPLRGMSIASPGRAATNGCWRIFPTGPPP